MVMQKKVIIGNWKMHKTLNEALTFVQELKPHLNDSLIIGLAAPFTLISSLVKECVQTELMIGAQNMNDATEGAFTGEIAGKMLIDAGAKFVLLGHSERRQLYHESDAFINRKVKRALLDGIQPILCIGETHAEYENKETEQVLKLQLQHCLQDLNEYELNSLMIAYEPIWAIGTGLSASEEQIDSVAFSIKEALTELFSQDFAENTALLYGGSVSCANAQQLLSQVNINGLLIGGASLSLESFCQIVNDNSR